MKTTGIHNQKVDRIQKARIQAFWNGHLNRSQLENKQKEKCYAKKTMDSYNPIRWNACRASGQHRN